MLSSLESTVMFNLKKFKNKQPGELFSIANIPVAETSAHNEVFYYWQHSGLKNSLLLHVDAHSDIYDGAPFKEKLFENYFKKLNVANFICPAKVYGFIDDVFWFNPHKPENKLVLLENSLKIEKKDTFPFLSKLFFGETLSWAYGNSHYDLQIANLIFDEDLFEPVNWLSIKNNIFEISLYQPFILDVDLDAFCLDMPGRSLIRCEIDNYEQRIDETIDLLSSLKKPDLITITTSQEPDYYVPPYLVKEVKDLFYDKLKTLYNDD